MTINVTYKPTEYRALYWRSLIGTYVTVGWNNNLVNECGWCGITTSGADICDECNE